MKTIFGKQKLWMNTLISGVPKSAFCMLMLYVAGFVMIMGLLIIGASFIKNKVVSDYFTERKNRIIQKLSAYAILLTGILYLVHNLHAHH